MEIVQAIVLALVQGLTEFLPVSSTAHLILAPVMLGWRDQGLAFDVAVHAGTLGAVVWAFRGEFARLFAEWKSPRNALASGRETRLALAVALATVPAAVAGLLFGHFVETELRGALVIATTTVVFALLLWVADFRSTRSPGARDEYQMGWSAIVVIGLAQAIALIPGTSRSGITMTAALFLGMSRTAAARFSFLMSIPVIVLAALWSSRQLIAADVAANAVPMLVGAVVAFVTAYLTIRAFLALLERVGFLPFVIYRLVLGAVLFGVFWA